MSLYWRPFSVLSLSQEQKYCTEMLQCHLGEKVSDWCPQLLACSQTSILLQHWIVELVWKYWMRAKQAHRHPAFFPRDISSNLQFRDILSQKIYPYLIFLESVISHEVIHGKHINCAITQMQNQLGWNVLLHTKHWKWIFV